MLLEKADAVCFCGSVELSWGFVLVWFLFGMFLGGGGKSQLYFKWECWSKWRFWKKRNEHGSSFSCMVKWKDGVSLK